MKTSRLLVLFITLILLSASSVARADLYVFGGGGIMAHEFVDVSSPSAFKIGAGYMSPSNVGFEGSYMNLGTGAISSGGSLSMSGYNLSGVFELPLNPLIMTFKGGMYSIDANSTIYAPASSTGFSWGILIGYEISERMMLSMDMEGFANVASGGGKYETPTLVTFGVRYRL